LFLLVAQIVYLCVLCHQTAVFHSSSSTCVCDCLCLPTVCFQQLQSLLLKPNSLKLWIDTGNLEESGDERELHRVKYPFSQE